MHIPEHAQFETYFWSCSVRIIVLSKKMAERNAPKCCKWRPIILWVYLVHSNLLVMSSATMWWLESNAQASQTSGRGIQASSPHRTIQTQDLSQLQGFLVVCIHSDSQICILKALLFAANLLKLFSANNNPTQHPFSGFYGLKEEHL